MPLMRNLSRGSSFTSRDDPERRSSSATGIPTIPRKKNKMTPTAIKRNSSWERPNSPLKRNSSRELPTGEHGMDLLGTSSHHGTSSHNRNGSSHNRISSNSSNNKAVPGRPRRRKTDGTPGGSGGSGRRIGRKRGFWYRFYKRWIYPSLNSFSSLFIAVLLWYSLGVISIGTSKLLLMPRHDGTSGVPPLFLTFQQLIIGSSLLRCMLQLRFMGSSGLQAWPSASGTSMDTNSVLQTQERYTYFDNKNRNRNKSPSHSPSSSSTYYQSLLDLPSTLNPSLLKAGVYFSFGFLATNFGFSGSSASFVETIKAAEPITSASVAVLWGIESLSRSETASLGVIVAGVLLSTLGNSAGSHNSSTTVAEDGSSAAATTNFAESVQVCLIVMAANLCFSFRGLYQKIFRASSEGSTQVVDDINLQFRMQQIGACLLVIPVILFESSTILQLLWNSSKAYGGMIPIGVMWQYIALALVNGCAFASYNLASTFILSRISVVHHAALNCLRRIFAIIVTSVVFAVPITFMGAFGIIVSVVGFLSFTHYKIQRQRQPKPLSSLLPVSAAKSLPSLPNVKTYP
jgi:drug/metabolite transporter (DMT)-like permease